jgi:uncharacterized protein
MLLDLSRMRGDRDHFDRAYEPAALATGQDEDFRVAAPVHLVFDLFKKRRDVRLAGRVSTVLELQCGRCLEPFTLPVDSAFDLLFLPHSENRGEGEVEIEEDDLETAFYKDRVIDLGQLMREQFYLALPMKPLCGEACKGLCAQCGTNLNSGPCDCKPEWVDPRLEALRGLTDEK